MAAASQMMGISAVERSLSSLMRCFPARVSCMLSCAQEPGPRPLLTEIDISTTIGVIRGFLFAVLAAAGFQLQPSKPQSTPDAAGVSELLQLLLSLKDQPSVKVHTEFSRWAAELADAEAVLEQVSAALCEHRSPPDKDPPGPGEAARGAEAACAGAAAAASHEQSRAEPRDSLPAAADAPAEDSNMVHPELPPSMDDEYSGEENYLVDEAGAWVGAGTNASSDCGSNSTPPGPVDPTSAEQPGAATNAAVVAEAEPADAQAAVVAIECSLAGVLSGATESSDEAFMAPSVGMRTISGLSDDDTHIAAFHGPARGRLENDALPRQWHESGGVVNVSGISRALLRRHSNPDIMAGGSCRSGTTQCSSSSDTGLRRQRVPIPTSSGCASADLLQHEAGSAAQAVFHPDVLGRPRGLDSATASRTGAPAHGTAHSPPLNTQGQKHKSWMLAVPAEVGRHEDGSALRGGSASQFLSNCAEPHRRQCPCIPTSAVNAAAAADPGDEALCHHSGSMSIASAPRTTSGGSAPPSSSSSSASRSAGENVPCPTSSKLQGPPGASLPRGQSPEPLLLPPALQASFHPIDKRDTGAGGSGAAGHNPEAWSTATEGMAGQGPGFASAAVPSSASRTESGTRSEAAMEQEGIQQAADGLSECSSGQTNDLGRMPTLDDASLAASASVISLRSAERPWRRKSLPSSSQKSATSSHPRRASFPTQRSDASARGALAGKDAAAVPIAAPANQRLKVREWRKLGWFFGNLYK